jgi:hypothetical protein
VCLDVLVKAMFNFKLKIWLLLNVFYPSHELYASCCPPNPYGIHAIGVRFIGSEIAILRIRYPVWLLSGIVDYASCYVLIFH